MRQTTDKPKRIRSPVKFTSIIISSFLGNDAIKLPRTLELKAQNKTYIRDKKECVTKKQYLLTIGA